MSRSRLLALSTAIFVIAAATTARGVPPSGGVPSAGRPEVADRAPEFPTPGPEGWINASPLRMSDLRGKVVLLDIWTFG